MHIATIAAPVAAPPADRPIGWQPLATAPQDERVLLATSGDWVGEAYMLLDDDTGEQEWTWADGRPVLRLRPLGWMPLPGALSEPVEGR